MGTKTERNIARLRRQERVRKKVLGTKACPRLTVFRSAKHIYAQIIEDEEGKTLVAASTLTPEKVGLGDGDYSGNIAAAEKVGLAIAKVALANNIEKVIFDRNGFLYHGRIKALADGARKGGLIF
ncbi:MAG: 50S ribosomal protein L18 [bacterium]|nr:50S ribosomal protein L18 [bacterium]